MSPEQPASASSPHCFLRAQPNRVLTARGSARVPVRSAGRSTARRPASASRWRPCPPAFLDPSPRPERRGVRRRAHQRGGLQFRHGTVGVMAYRPHGCAPIAAGGPRDGRSGLAERASGTGDPAGTRSTKPPHGRTPRPHRRCRFTSPLPHLTGRLTTKAVRQAAQYHAHSTRRVPTRERWCTTSYLVARAGRRSDGKPSTPRVCRT